MDVRGVPEVWTSRWSWREVRVFEVVVAGSVDFKVVVAGGVVVAAAVAEGVAAA